MSIRWKEVVRHYVLCHPFISSARIYLNTSYFFSSRFFSLNKGVDSLSFMFEIRIHLTCPSIAWGKNSNLYWIVRINSITNTHTHTQHCRKVKAKCTRNCNFRPREHSFNPFIRFFILHTMPFMNTDKHNANVNRNETRVKRER